MYVRHTSVYKEMPFISAWFELPSIFLYLSIQKAKETTICKESTHLWLFICMKVMFAYEKILLQSHSKTTFFTLVYSLIVAYIIFIGTSVGIRVYTHKRLLSGFVVGCCPRVSNSTLVIVCVIAYIIYIERENINICTWESGIIQSVYIRMHIYTHIRECVCVCVCQ